MRKSSKAAIALVCVLVVAGAVWYFAGDRLMALAGGDGEQQEQGGGRPVPVNLGEVRTGRVLVTTETTGTLEARERVSLTTDARGLVRDVSFDEGDPVEAGEVLVRLDAAEEEARLRSARARRDEIALQLARAQELAADDFAAEARVDELQAQLAEAAAEVEVAQAQLEERTIEAPFDGWIGLRMVSPGSLVTPGTEIAELWSIDPIDLRFRVPAGLLPRLERGQTVIGTGAALPGGRIEGEVRVIENAVADDTRTVALEASFDNSGRQLRPGTFAEVELVLETRNDALIVPEQAILLQGSKAYVFTVDDQNVAHRREVRIGERRQGEAEITDGLEPGQRIVVAGLQGLSDGQQVTPAANQSGGSGGSAQQPRDAGSS